MLLVIATMWAKGVEQLAELNEAGGLRCGRGRRRMLPPQVGEVEPNMACADLHIVECGYIQLRR